MAHSPIPDVGGDLILKPRYSVEHHGQVQILIIRSAKPPDHNRHRNGLCYNSWNWLHERGGGVRFPKKIAPIRMFNYTWPAVHNNND